jgi:predicted nucleotidyltransferase
MMKLSQLTLNDISRRLIDTLHPCLIYLYGSHAYGTPHQDSDIDLLVVVDAKEEETTRLAAKAYAALRGLKMPVELNVVSRKGFEQRRHWASSVEHEVAERGTRLHAA